MILSIMCVTESVGGFEGNTILYEVYLYVLDAVPTAVMLAFSIWHPSQFSNQVRKCVEGSETTGSIMELETPWVLPIDR